MARVRYLGGGFLKNIPSRDLSADEVKRYGLERLLKSGLYEDLYPPKKTQVDYEVEVEQLSKELEEIEETFDTIEEG
jgi:hypothetical protein